MLLRTTLSNTKKFFQKTVENFKSFLSGGYQRLPKKSPCNSFPCGGGGGGGALDHQVNYSQSLKELGKFTREFGNDQQANKGRISKKKETPTAVLPRKDELVGTRGNPRKKKILSEGKRYYQEYSRSARGSDRERSFLVARKLKELEMLDNGNVEHVLDIEEVLHYYSRLTCPAYVDIVDQFFMDMYSELLNGEASTTASEHHSNSRPRLQTVGFYN